MGPWSEAFPAAAAGTQTASKSGRPPRCLAVSWQAATGRFRSGVYATAPAALAHKAGMRAAPRAMLRIVPRLARRSPSTATKLQGAPGKSAHGLLAAAAAESGPDSVRWRALRAAMATAQRTSGRRTARCVMNAVAACGRWTIGGIAAPLAASGCERERFGVLPSLRQTAKVVAPNLHDPRAAMVTSDAPGFLETGPHAQTIAVPALR
mmetsp:Transcript_39894/g.93388  ORF Transcript_39894/g.93388 Transcript_39894/m.93388 type:complete len:208 (-) Transcript_39894:632-1255(-)